MKQLMKVLLVLQRQDAQTDQLQGEHQTDPPYKKGVRRLLESSSNSRRKAIIKKTWLWQYALVVLIHMYENPNNDVKGNQHSRDTWKEEKHEGSEDETGHQIGHRALDDFHARRSPWRAGRVRGPIQMRRNLLDAGAQKLSLENYLRINLHVHRP